MKWKVADSTPTEIQLPDTITWIELNEVNCCLVEVERGVIDRSKKQNVIESILKRQVAPRKTSLFRFVEQVGALVRGDS